MRNNQFLHIRDRGLDLEFSLIEYSRPRLFAFLLLSKFKLEAAKRPGVQLAVLIEYLERAIENHKIQGMN